MANKCTQTCHYQRSYITLRSNSRRGHEPLHCTAAASLPTTAQQQHHYSLLHSSSITTLHCTAAAALLSTVQQQLRSLLHSSGITGGKLINEVEDIRVVVLLLLWVRLPLVPREHRRLENLQDDRCGCVTTETRHLDRLGQLGEFEQDSNTDRCVCVCVTRSARPPACVLQQRHGISIGVCVLQQRHGISAGVPNLKALRSYNGST